MNWLLFLIIIILTIGCNNLTQGQYQYFPQRKENHIINIYLENKFNADEHEEIAIAVDSWNYVLNGYVVLKIREPNEWENGDILYIHYIDSKNSMVVDTETETKLGFADAVGGENIYLVMDRLSPDKIKLYHVTLHELGHILGAGHGGNGLMSEFYDENKYHCVDFWTAEQVSNYFLLEVSDLRYC